MTKKLLVLMGVFVMVAVACRYDDGPYLEDTFFDYSGPTVCAGLQYEYDYIATKPMNGPIVVGLRATSFPCALPPGQEVPDPGEVIPDAGEGAGGVSGAGGDLEGTGGATGVGGSLEGTGGILGTGGSATEEDGGQEDSGEPEEHDAGAQDSGYDAGVQDAGHTTDAGHGCGHHKVCVNVVECTHYNSHHTCTHWKTKKVCHEEDGDDDDHEGSGHHNGHGHDNNGHGHNNNGHHDEHEGDD